MDKPQSLVYICYIIWWMICNFINVPYQDQYMLTKLCKSVWTIIELFVCPLTSGVNRPMILSYYYSSKNDAAPNEMRWYCRLTHIQVGDPVLHQDLLLLASISMKIGTDISMTDFLVIGIWLPWKKSLYDAGCFCTKIRMLLCFRPLMKSSDSDLKWYLTVFYLH